jgi:hypothetical protein
MIMARSPPGPGRPPRLESPTHDPADEPEAHSEALGIVEVGMHCQDGAEIHDEAGFLLKFPPCRGPHFLTPFHVAAGNALVTGVGPGPAPAPEDLLSPPHHHRHPHRGIHIQDLAVVLADQARLAASDLVGPSNPPQQGQ